MNHRHLHAAILLTILFASTSLLGCNKPSSDETTRMRGEVEAMKVEVAKTRAENEIMLVKLKAELEIMRIEREQRVTNRNGGDNPKVKNDSEVLRAMMASRLASTTQISYETERQAAFVKLAVDAAEVGNVDIAKECISKINYETQKQETIYKVALRFAKNGKGEDALEMAKKISYEAPRQKVLSKIAKGELDD